MINDTPKIPVKNPRMVEAPTYTVKGNVTPSRVEMDFKNILVAMYKLKPALSAKR